MARRSLALVALLVLILPILLERPWAWWWETGIALRALAAVVLGGCLLGPAWWSWRGAVAGALVAAIAGSLQALLGDVPPEPGDEIIAGTVRRALILAWAYPALLVAPALLVLRRSACATC